MSFKLMYAAVVQVSKLVWNSRHQKIENGFQHLETWTSALSREPRKRKINATAKWFSTNMKRKRRKCHCQTSSYQYLSILWPMVWQRLFTNESLGTGRSCWPLPILISLWDDMEVPDVNSSGLFPCVSTLTDLCHELLSRRLLGGKDTRERDINVWFLKVQTLDSKDSNLRI